MAVDIDKIRKDFPILSRRVRGKPLVYLDNAATSQKPRAVIEALSNFYENTNANVHRGIHTLSEEATALYEEARKKVARFVHAPSPESVIFTRNTTESINLVAHAWGRKFINPGDEILLTGMEHHSNLVPWQILAQEKGAVLKFVEVRPDGTLNLEDLDRNAGPRTKLIAVTHVSNAIGTINPIRRFAQVAKSLGALLLVDAAQSVPHIPVDMRVLGCDFLAFSAHKMMGPTGVGVLIAHEEMLEKMSPFLGGGDMIREVWLEKATWNELPYKFEAGTPNFAGVAAFGAALDYLQGLGMDNVRAHEQELIGYALKSLLQIEGITIYGPMDSAQRSGVVSFNLGTIHPHDLGTVLDEDGIAVRAGHHCCQPLMRRLGINGTTRASVYVYNTKEEIDKFAKSLDRARTLFGVCAPSPTDRPAKPSAKKEGR
ncbi:MAG: cysteine desulfurase [Elusimicrobia bacterium RIFCSPLOWO2_01_FULL_64_13]|nr:MAG: cysteine desulfurase [Elusimicrobia bacterium RIFCSPHIGHO2_01_FULL_64_10]OGR97816.1 MAG: cysteine desulfurase [Elusimicrobia bacterium RIFCSPLOWO2_01_FULL_64_13]